jgi:hypothetical protein
VTPPVTLKIVSNIYRNHLNVQVVFLVLLLIPGRGPVMTYS